MAIVTKERGVEDVCRAMENHPDCRALIDAACSALWSLSMAGE